MPLKAMNIGLGDKKIFEELLNRLQEQYDFIIETPYNNGYRIFKLKSGYVLGEFNSDAHNLLYNITQLSEVLRGLTR